MSFDLKLSGRRAIVTGGTKGVGTAVVTALLDAGVTVMASARTVPETERAGLHTVAADLTTAAGCQELSGSRGVSRLTPSRRDYRH